MFLTSEKEPSRAASIASEFSTMASTSITKVGGITVVTQVIPQEEASAHPLAPVTGTPPPAATPLSNKNDMSASFLLGEPHALGIVQIVLGLLCVLFSVTATFSPILLTHAPFSLAILFVISGSLSLAASRHGSVGLVWASLVSNIIAVLIALAGVSFVCWLLADLPPSQQLCDLYLDSYTWNDCNRIWGLNNVLYGLRGLLLVLLVLQVCVSITVCVFSVKTIRRRNHYNTLTVEYTGSGNS
ncbi:hypothetical protein Q5P01_011855 [Channa striata]|uniref:Membrane-spanning 4-domains subfamily A member 4A n=1 Tax=Channa striata TaxID=64152 RepID=A0AA88MU65_CHASR|nr:hypothetical protein Q5P01_011855 [Channa striata]